MVESEQFQDAVDKKLRRWRQGDLSRDSGLEFIHLADILQPLSCASLKVSEECDGETQTANLGSIHEEVAGFVLLTQTCDIIRKCRDRPYVEVSPLVMRDKKFVEEVRRQKRPAFAYVPTISQDCLVADLDRVMTLEKAVVANWGRIPGWETDAESREFSRALARKRSRFAFPDDFSRAAKRFVNHLIGKHNRESFEGEFLRELREIRVRAGPSWNAEHVELTIFFIMDFDLGGDDSGRIEQVNKWLELFDSESRFRLAPPVVCFLEDITARDYLDSDRLDLDLLSAS